MVVLLHSNRDPMAFSVRVQYFSSFSLSLLLSTTHYSNCMGWVGVICPFILLSSWKFVSRGRRRRCNEIDHQSKWERLSLLRSHVSTRYIHPAAEMWLLKSPVLSCVFGVKNDDDESTVSIYGRKKLNF